MVRQKQETPPRGLDCESWVKEIRAERAALRTERQTLSSDLQALDAKDAELAAAEATIIALMPPEKRKLYVAEAADTSARGGETYGRIVELFNNTKRRGWCAVDVQEALKRRGVDTDLKPIHNVLNYLARENRLRRISRGMYYVPEFGVGIVTSDRLLDDDPE
jgi:hypothetical protein